MQYGVSQTQTLQVDNTPKPLTEVIVEETPTPQQVFAKHNITNIKTAGLEQLQAALTNVRAIIKNLLPTDQTNKDIWIPVRIDLKIQIENLEQEAQNKEQYKSNTKELLDFLSNLISKENFKRD